MPLQGDYEPSPVKWVRDQVEEYESSGGTRGTTLRGAPVVVITSIGASSGKLRKNPVMRVEHDGVYAAVASWGGAPENPAWYRNIVEHPDIELQDGPSKGDYAAREAVGDERDFWWSRAVEAWPDYAQYQAKTERQIPVLVLEPAHWGAVGGLWHEIGELQFQLMVDEGLTPRHRLLDVGCGSLRGGVHFIRHLDAGHYVGVDADAWLLEAGRGEIARAGLEAKRPMLVHRDDFEFRDLGVFDFAIAQSLFTHLPFNSIVRCLARTAQVLRPGGRLLATFFANTGSRLRTEALVIHARDGVVLTINLDDDPYYYVPELFEWVCEGSDLSCEYRGEWGHPRDQHLLAFTKRS